MRFVVSCFVTVLCLGTTAAFAAAPEPTTDEQKTLYALGLAINQSLGNFTLSEPEFELVKSGITDGFFKRPKVDLQTFGLKISELQQARASVVAEAEKKVGAAFLAKAAAESGAKKTESGAIITTIKEGERRDPESHGYGEDALSRNPDRRDGVRSFRQAGRAGHNPIE